MTNAVRSTFQTYVESLKASGGFGEEEQLIALGRAKAIILSEMTIELKDWVTTTMAIYNLGFLIKSKHLFTN